jgi:predicted AlkP superfamily pyrophosphatase or phosphodiesterase
MPLLANFDRGVLPEGLAGCNPLTPCPLACNPLGYRVERLLVGGKERALSTGEASIMFRQHGLSPVAPRPLHGVVYWQVSVQVAHLHFLEM